MKNWDAWVDLGENRVKIILADFYMSRKGYFKNGNFGKKTNK